MSNVEEIGDLILKKKTLTLRVAGFFLLLDQGLKFFSPDFNGAYCNPDGPWGMPVGSGMLVVVMFVALAGLMYFFWKTESTAVCFPLGLILAGGVSNLFDRITFGCVRDFAFVSWFPAFNLADVLLTVGVLALFVVTVSGRK